MKNYYPNLLANQNYVAKVDGVWCADITIFEIKEGKKIYVYFCLDMYSNRMLLSFIRSQPIGATDIIKRLNQLINERLPIKPRNEVIIHTDRETQFSCQEYKEFFEENHGFVRGSMSQPAHPKDNAVAERFMRTFQNHRINGKRFQEEIFEQLENNPKFQGYQKIFNLYLKSLNLQVEPKYSKAFSEHYGEDFRRDDINQYSH